jgi:hypothetical protein
VFPDGDTGRCPIQLDGVRRIPKFLPATAQELRSAIPMAKHAASIEVFAKDGVTASIMTGSSPKR